MDTHCDDFVVFEKLFTSGGETALRSALSSMAHLVTKSRRPVDCAFERGTELTKNSSIYGLRPETVKMIEICWKSS